MSPARANLWTIALLCIVAACVGCNGPDPMQPATLDYGLRRCEDDQDMLVGRVGVAQHPHEEPESQFQCGCGNVGQMAVTYRDQRVTFWARDYRCDSTSVPCSAERQVGDVKSGIQVAHGYYVDDELRACPYVIEEGQVAKPTCALGVTMEGHANGIDGLVFAEMVKTCMQTNQPPVIEGPYGPENDPWFSPAGDERDNDGFDQTIWLENRLSSPAWDAAVHCVEVEIEGRFGVTWDDDGDGTCDASDNCRGVSNPNQINTDHGQVGGDDDGDDCDEDDDGDGLTDIEERENYGTDPLKADSDEDHYRDGQELRGDDVDGPTLPPDDPRLDVDGDGMIDPNDTDSDNDGVRDGWDLTASTYQPEEPNQKEERVDTDGDGLLDVHDLDSDNDGVPDGPDGDVPMDPDNCRRIANTDQEDRDRDGLGDVCDPDRDGDGFYNDGWTDDPSWSFDEVPADERDNCPDVSNADQADRDNDGIGDACDTCLEVENGLVVDTDDDGVGDAQADTDGDGDGDACDNCPHTVNPEQEDADGDEWGDACEIQIKITKPGTDFPSADELIAGTRQPLPSQVKVYPANDNPVLTFEIEVELKTDEAAEGLTIQWHVDAVGDIPPQFGETLIRRDEGAEYIFGEVFARFVGMPALATDFGRKRIGLSVSWRGRVIAELPPEEVRTIAVGWPIFKPGPPGPPSFVDTSFAKNHPGEDLPLPPVRPRRDPEFVDGEYVGDWVWNRSREPNWFYYFMQMEQAGLAGATYLSSLDVTYVVLTSWPRDFTPSQYEVSARYVAGGDVPEESDGTLTYGTGTSDVQVFDSAAYPSANGTYVPPVVSFHARMRHEFQHFKQFQRWTQDGRGLHMPAHSDWIQDYWSQWTEASAFNHYRDLDSDGQFSVEAACDLNGDGDDEDALLEDDVVFNCWAVADQDADLPGESDADRDGGVGGSPVVFDVNFDGLPTSPLHEWEVESLDWDHDHVPNWEDQLTESAHELAQYEHDDRPWELEPERIEDEFVVILLAADPFRESDWGCPGVNIPAEGNCP